MEKDRDLQRRAVMLEYVDVATRMKLLRTVAKQEQRQVAKRAGYNINTVSGLESGRLKAVRPTTLAAIAGALGVEVEALTDDAACIRAIARIAGVELGMQVEPPRAEDDRPVTHREVRELLRAELRAELHRIAGGQNETRQEDAEQRQ